MAKADKTPELRRSIDPSHDFRAKNLRPLAKVLRSSLMALGYVQSAGTLFTKLKSRTVSPDGYLGGRGYIQDISSIRQKFMECAEALSGIADTLHDEIHAPHWDPSFARNKQIIDEVDELRRDPEVFVEEHDFELDPEEMRDLDEELDQVISDKEDSEQPTMRLASAFLKKLATADTSNIVSAYMRAKFHV